MSLVFELRIDGAPRTKKTHNQVVRVGKAKRTMVLPSKAWRTWYALAHIVEVKDALLHTWPLRGRECPKRDYNCRALFYRDAARGDAVGYYQGLADLLEKRGVLVNDSCITQWDGSRLLIDRERPRVEVVLSEVA